MANKWELFITMSTYPPCAPFSSNEITMTYKVTGDCTLPYQCGVIVPYGTTCSDNIQSQVTNMINYFKTHANYNPLMTDADTVYVNGALYYTPTGSIYFDSNPQGAEIWLAPNNIPIDTTFQTPYEISNLTPGIYAYILRKPYYNNYTNTINVIANQKANLLGQMAPYILYELYFKISNIFSAQHVQSILGTIYNEAGVINFLTDYYIESLAFDPITYIITIIISKNTEIVQIGNNSAFTFSGDYENVQSLQSDSAINALAVSIVILILFALGVVAAPEAIIVYGAALIVNYGLVTFLGKKESVITQPPSTREIMLNAVICLGTGADPCSTNTPLATDMTVSIVVTAGNSTPQTGNITRDSPTINFSVPTDVTVSIIANVLNNSNYTTFTADSSSNAALDVYTPGDPTTIPITIKLFAQANATVAPKIVDTSGNPLSGKYVLYIEDPRGVKVKDGSGDLINGQVPQGSIPANKEYCVAIIPSDYPIHSLTFWCSSCSAGEICSPTLVSKTCTESKNSMTVRCVYVSSSSARLGFTPDEIDITDISTGTVRKILPGTPTPDSTCPGVIASDITCVDGLENGKTYKVHVISSTYAVTTAAQDQQVTYTTDCGGIMLTVDASPPANTYDITIQVINSTLTVLSGAIVTLGTMPTETTGLDGSVMFPSVPQGTGIPLKVSLTGYTDYSDRIDVTTTKTVTVKVTVSTTSTPTPTPNPTPTVTPTPTPTVTPTPTPTVTPTPTPTVTPTPTPTVTPTPTPTVTPTPTPPPVVQAGFGTAGMVIVAGLVIGALYAIIKRKKSIP